FRFSRLPVVGKCPNCGRNVYEFQKSYSCEDSRGACGFFFMKEIFGKEVTPTQAKRILDKGCSITLKGFTDRSGASYSGKLVLQDGRVRVEREK
ncbi:MAG: topoisomerase C-terminal repeat-containing protein, partial [Candidatus Avelusimicrobium sp.]